MRTTRRILLCGVGALVAALWLGLGVEGTAEPGRAAAGQGRGRGGSRGAVIRPVGGKCPVGTAMIASDQCSRTVPLLSGECPPGTTLQRPTSCMFPKFMAPSILDYCPRTTLVVAEHVVPPAKYPVIDIHSHLRASELNLEQTIKEMDALCLQILVNLSGGSQPDQVKGRVDSITG